MKRTDENGGAGPDPGWVPASKSLSPSAVGLAGGGGRRHYHRIEEQPFTAEDRSRTTLLFGHLTPKHEALLRAVFERNGFRVVRLPEPTKQSFRTGKEYCSNGLCNPVYYTAGALIRYLRELESEGLTRDEINERYAYFTLSDCGPCRFGMYESEYRQALKNAGFDGFRVVTTHLNKTSRSGGKIPGLEFSTDQWFGIVNAIIVSDLLSAISCQLRPYEVNPGETNRAVDDCILMLEAFLRNRSHFELSEHVPTRAYRLLNRWPRLTVSLNVLGKFWDHFHSEKYGEVLDRCRNRLNSVAVDRTTPKPVVKIVGEFYSHIAENDANYRMFDFLEGEGAEVAPGSVGAVLLYWIYKSRQGHLARRGIDSPYPETHWWQPIRRFENWRAHVKKPLVYYVVDRLATWQYRRLSRALGGLARPITAQEKLADAAGSYYRPLTRGGEGHLEVGESIYCTTHRECHMVLSLKPFGCMPSTQSDGVMATVASHHDEMLFASIETTGDSEISAFSRVQMVLSDAHRRAANEFEQALEWTGKRVEDIREFVAEHPRLRRPGFKVRRFPGIAGAAANYVLHVSRLMDRRRTVFGGLPWPVKTNYGGRSLEWTSAPRRSKR